MTEGKVSYPISMMSLTGDAGRKTRDDFWNIAKTEFNNNRTECFCALIAEAVERREKSKK